MRNNNLPIAIIGGGPIGLAAAAHLVKRNLPFILFEAGPSIATNIRSWEHVSLFSPWQYNIDKAAEELLLKHGWIKPNINDLPTGISLIDQYLHPLATLLSSYAPIIYNSKVISVGRKNMDKMKTKNRDAQPFTVDVIHDYEYQRYEASAIIDTSGTWQNNNPISSSGVFTLGEIENKNKIFYGIPDILNRHKERYKNKNVLVVGGGHSAINSVLELAELKEKYPKTEIHWVLRKKKIQDIYGGQENDALPARGYLGIKIEELVNKEIVNVYTPFHINSITYENKSLTIIGQQHDEEKALYGIDEIISNTGTRPEFSFLREVRVEFDATVESVPAIADLIDPNIHSCGTVRPHGEFELRQKEKDFYIAGMKSYGRAPTFLMATGYEQVRSIVAALAGDMESARRVELNLPETGVCSSAPNENGVACCSKNIEVNT